MNYMICIPSPNMVSRENCEKIHNIMARISETHKLKIVPEPMKMKTGQYPDFYKKFRIYKEIKDRDGNGEAYLLSQYLSDRASPRRARSPATSASGRSAQITPSPTKS